MEQLGEKQTVSTSGPHHDLAAVASSYGPARTSSSTSESAAHLEQKGETSKV